MAKLDNLIRWQEFAPDLGENRSLKKPFVVLIAVGLTRPDLQRLAEQVEALVNAPVTDGADAASHLEAQAEKLAGALNEFVRMGPEPLTVDGEAIDTLPKLLRLYGRVVTGPIAMLEVATALKFFNSMEGQTELFYKRLSGGFVSTSRAAR